MPMPVPPVLLLVLGGCLDYQVKGKEVGLSPDSAETGFRLDTGTSDGPPCLEADTLADGTPVDEACIAEPITGLLDAVVEWSNPFTSDYADYGQVLMAPMVGELTDDDFDGDVDLDDIPDIVTVADDGEVDSDDHHGVLRVVDGAGRGVHTVVAMARYGADTQVYPYRFSNVALADVDGDRLPEIVLIVQTVGGVPETPVDTGGGPDTAVTGGGGGDSGTPPEEEVDVRPPPPEDTSGGTEADPASSCTVAAFRPDGTVLWVADTVSFGCGGHAPAVADLEGDGAVEVMVGATVVHGADGTPYWAGITGEARFSAYDEVGQLSFAMDLDGDGIQEVLAGRTVYAATGAEYCSIDDALDDGFPAAADLDGDGLGEFVLVGNGMAHVHDGDCRLLASWPIEGGGNGGPPTVGDFDADGSPEIGIAGADAYAVYEVDGTVLWSAPTVDESSHATGSSVFDFDSDGRAEVVYGDEVALRIYDGATGRVRFEDTTHTSRTLHEYPVIADVDLDGQAEIVVPQGGGHHGVSHTGVYVLGSASGSWLADRPIWNQHAYSITNINDDLTVPAPARPNWPQYNTFRSGDLSPLSGGAMPDAVSWGDVCTNGCTDGFVQVAVRVGNGGVGVMRGGVPISAYAEVDGYLRYLATMSTPDPVNSGDASQVLVFELDSSLIPAGVVVFKADDDRGTQVLAECHEDNNDARVEDVRCP